MKITTEDGEIVSEHRSAKDDCGTRECSGLSAYHPESEAEIETEIEVNSKSQTEVHSVTDTEMETENDN